MAHGDIAVSWHGLPQYAARLIRAALDRSPAKIGVVGSRPAVPVAGIEAALDQEVHWVEASAQVRWEDLGLPVPRLYFQSGWAYPAFNALGAQVKAARGKVVGFSDANWRGDLRQRLGGPIAFRLRHRRHFDAMLVPGAQGVRLMRYFGMPQDRILTGMYGADSGLFHGGPPLAERPKTFLFVGQFIDRKQVLPLADAFLRFHRYHPDWTLHMVGSGEQHAAIPQHPAIIVEDFVQPEELAARFHAARFLVLPSLVEAWGLVVHEAALCGCGLILSDVIGSGDDLANSTNAIRFPAGDGQAIEQALRRAATLDAAALAGVEAQSRNVARNFGPDAFADAFWMLADRLLGDGA